MSPACGISGHDLLVALTPPCGLALMAMQKGSASMSESYRENAYTVFFWGIVLCIILYVIGWMFG
jgi:hypothetical protein